MNLKPGEKLTSRDLLYAIMLRSANDGCYAAAVHVAGSQAKFVEMMNARARQIGCTTAHFANPHGLTAAGHKLSARDLALIGREAMKFPSFREVVRTQKWVVTRSINQKDKQFYNRNRYLRQDPTADGIKTGFTTPAGQCYVGSATRNGYRLITAILGSKNHRKDHAALLNWGYANYQPFRWFAKDETVTVADLPDGRRVEAVAAADVRAMRGVNGVQPHILWVEVNRKDDRLGTALAEYPSGERFRIDVKEGKTLGSPAVVGTSSVSTWVVGGVMLAGAALIRRKSRKEIPDARATTWPA
jgi:D-alanyl-D-alanine carboxypeptidase (penicillin-binding protein 5/6)